MGSWLKRLRHNAKNRDREASGLSPAVQARLQSLAFVLRENPRARAVLTLPPHGSASDLSAVREYLLALGVEPTRLGVPPGPESMGA